MNGKLKAASLLVVMYILGVASGLAWKSFQHHPFGGTHRAYSERRISRLKTQLRLSPAQEQAFRDIFQKAEDRTSAINQQVSGQLIAIHRDSVLAIQKVLTPEQWAEFEKIHTKYHLRQKQIPVEEKGPPAIEGNRGE